MDRRAPPGGWSRNPPHRVLRRVRVQSIAELLDLATLKSWWVFRGQASRKWLSIKQRERRQFSCNRGRRIAVESYEKEEGIGGRLKSAQSCRKRYRSRRVRCSN